MSIPTVEPRATTPKFAWRVPVLGAVPNVPSDMTNLALDIEAEVLKGVPIFANAAARNSAIPAPIIGQTVYLQDTKVHETWTGTKWAAGGKSAPSLVPSQYGSTIIYGAASTDAAGIASMTFATPFVSTPVAVATPIGGATYKALAFSIVALTPSMVQCGVWNLPGTAQVGLSVQFIIIGTLP